MKTVLTVALLGAVVGLTGCDLQPALSPADAARRATCRPTTRVYATAPTVAEVKRELLAVPGVAHVHVLWKYTKHGRTPVSLRASTHERIGMPMLRRLPSG